MTLNPTDTAWLKAFDAVRRSAAADGLWGGILGAPGDSLPACRLHLAVFVEPFLGYLLDGSKTIESRFGVTRRAPYRQVRTDDVVLLKRAGGPVVGLCRAGRAWYYNLDPAAWKDIREGFTTAMRVQDPAFWRSRQAAAFATLFQVRDVLPVDPVAWPKRSRQGWVVLSPGVDCNGGLWS